MTLASKPDKQPKKKDLGAPGSDIADFGSVDLSNDYPPGTFFHMPDGSTVEMNELPDPFEGTDGTPEEGKPQDIRR